MLIKDLYQIADFSEAEGSYTATIRLNVAHEIFKGHFPGNPVMPGVCMIQIIKELTEKATEKRLFLVHSSNIKFMAIINPEKNEYVNLKVSFTEKSGQIHIKNTSFVEEVLALKMSAVFDVTS